MRFIDVFGEEIEVVVRKVSYADNGSLAVYLFWIKPMTMNHMHCLL